jgi:uncharacterized protein (TIGR02270 family)
LVFSKSLKESRIETSMKKEEKKERPILTEGPSEKGFYVGLYLEHLEEASFLYETRLGLMNDPEIDWVDIDGYEDRLEAHIDGLVVGETLALGVCRMQAGSGDAGELYAALCVFCRQRQREDFLEIVNGLDFNDLERVRAVTDALKHEMPQSWRDLIEEMLSSGEPNRVRIASLVAGWRRFPLGGLLREVLEKNGTETFPELIWALGRLGDPTIHHLLKNHLEHEDDALSFEAALALLRSGHLELVPSLLTKAETKEWPFILIGLAGTREMAKSIHDMLRKRKRGEEAILALGFLGDLSSIDILIDHLTQKELSPAAAMALNLILCSDLYEEVAVPEETDPDALFEEEREQLKNDAPLSGETGEISTRGGRRLSENPDQWKQWWGENKKRFDSKTAYRNGKPFAMGAIVETLVRKETPHLVRRLSLEEIVIKGGKDPGIEADARVAAQKRALMGSS